jgi:hypothetical protein
MAATVVPGHCGPPGRHVEAVKVLNLFRHPMPLARKVQIRGADVRIGSERRAPLTFGSFASTHFGPFVHTPAKRGSRSEVPTYTASSRGRWFRFLNYRNQMRHCVI